MKGAGYISVGSECHVLRRNFLTEIPVAKSRKICRGRIYKSRKKDVRGVTWVAVGIKTEFFYSYTKETL
jgi:hypothetical protein